MFIALMVVPIASGAEPLAGLIKVLETGNDAERIKAAGAIVKLGKRGAPAARALCAAAASAGDGSKERRDACLSAWCAPQKVVQVV
jgi:hypothetical protein